VLYRANLKQLKVFGRLSQLANKLLSKDRKQKSLININRWLVIINKLRARDYKLQYTPIERWGIII